MLTISHRLLGGISCLVLLLTSEVALAADVDCLSQDIAQVSTGRLLAKECLVNGASVSVWSLRDRELLRGPYPIVLKARNSQADLVVFQGARVKETGCAGEVYLVDLKDSAPRLFRFGVKGACNEFDWASWGAKSSVIALKNNVRFVYTAGKLVPPKKDNALFSSIKPSMFETPVESLEPFAVEVVPE